MIGEVFGIVRRMPADTPQHLLDHEARLAGRQLHAQLTSLQIAAPRDLLDRTWRWLPVVETTFDDNGRPAHRTQLLLRIDVEHHGLLDWRTRP